MKTYDEIVENVIEATAAHRRKVKKIQRITAVSAMCAVCVAGLSVYMNLEPQMTLPSTSETETMTVSTAVTTTADRIEQPPASSEATESITSAANPIPAATDATEASDVTATQQTSQQNETLPIQSESPSNVQSEQPITTPQQQSTTVPPATEPTQPPTQITTAPVTAATPPLTEPTEPTNTRPPMDTDNTSPSATTPTLPDFNYTMPTSSDCTDVAPPTGYPYDPSDVQTNTTTTTTTTTTETTTTTTTVSVQAITPIKALSSENYSLEFTFEENEWLHWVELDLMLQVTVSCPVSAETTETLQFPIK